MKRAPIMLIALGAALLTACRPIPSGPAGQSAPASSEAAQSAASVDPEAASSALRAVSDYEPGSAGSSLKRCIAAAKLLNFTETYDGAAQEQSLSDAAEAYLGGLTEEQLARFSENLPEVLQAAKEIAAGGEGTAELLEEAGNPQAYDAYTPSKLDAAAAVISGCLEKLR